MEVQAGKAEVEVSGAHPERSWWASRGTVAPDPPKYVQGTLISAEGTKFVSNSQKSPQSPRLRDTTREPRQWDKWPRGAPRTQRGETGSLATHSSLNPGPGKPRELRSGTSTHWGLPS